jgi:hypothetical protein
LVGRRFHRPREQVDARDYDVAPGGNERQALGADGEPQDLLVAEEPQRAADRGVRPGGAREREPHRPDPPEVVTDEVEVEQLMPMPSKSIEVTPQVAVLELVLGDVQRDALAGQFDRVGRERAALGVTRPRFRMVSCPTMAARRLLTVRSRRSSTLI